MAKLNRFALIGAMALFVCVSACAVRVDQATPVFDATVSKSRTQTAATYWATNLSWTLVPATATPKISPTFLPLPTSTLRPIVTRLPTPTTILRIEWKTYTDPQRRFSFEYPAWYDNNPSGCGVRKEIDRLKFGDNDLMVTSTELSLREHVLAVNSQVADEVLRIEEFVSPQGLTVYLIQYYWRSIYKSAVTAYFKRDNQVYTLHVLLSLACTNQDMGIMNPDMLYHAIDTFRFQ